MVAWYSNCVVVHKYRACWSDSCMLVWKTAWRATGVARLGRG